MMKDRFDRLLRTGEGGWKKAGEEWGEKEMEDESYTVVWRNYFKYFAMVFTAERN